VERGAESEGPVSFLYMDNAAAREHCPVHKRHVKRAMAALGGRAVVERGAPWLPAPDLRLLMTPTRWTRSPLVSCSARSRSAREEGSSMRHVFSSHKFATRARL